MSKITKRQVEGMKPAASDVFAWDDELRGFGVRVKPSGLRSYVVQYRNAHGRSKRMTIGEHGRLTAEEARKQARLPGIVCGPIRSPRRRRDAAPCNRARTLLRQVRTAHGGKATPDRLLVLVNDRYGPLGNSVQC